MKCKKVIRKPFAILGVALSAAGGSVGPNYETPDVPVPAAWKKRRRKASTHAQLN